jgi:hypothetical protein
MVQATRRPNIATLFLLNKQTIMIFVSNSHQEVLLFLAKAKGQMFWVGTYTLLV